MEKAKAAGVAMIAEASTLGVGRRADILLAVSKAAGLPLIAPTGIYREQWVPDWAREASEGALRDWMVKELTGEIEKTGVRAGWIKIGASDGGMTTAERKVLRAAAAAGKSTGAVIGSHTTRGRVAREQLDEIEGAGYRPDRFIWIHAQAEYDSAIHLELARRGAWVEFDSIGDGQDRRHLQNIQRMLEAGLADRLLLSHDRGWYDPAAPGGGYPLPFTYLTETFLPKLREAGVGDATLRQITRENPFRAFAA